MFMDDIHSYVPPLFRPPSEARSLIFQVTYGCSHDTCTFCRMYKGKRFRKRREADVLAEFEAASRIYPREKRIFLADGDAMALSARALTLYLERLRELFPRLERVSAYASPQNLLGRKREDLEKVRRAGLELLYIGVESGSDEILRRVRKGATSRQIVEACRKAKEAGLRTSVTVILGLGGPEMSMEHAAETGRVLTDCRPDYIGALTLMIHEGNAGFAETFGRHWRPLTVEETLKEELRLLQAIGCDECEFRSNHASNWLALKGRLQRDKQVLTGLIEEVLEDPASDLLRPEWLRAL
jgi:radical SAM superfamily enzyme YgiQ (UPF0313 family)